MANFERERNWGDGVEKWREIKKGSNIREREMGILKLEDCRYRRGSKRGQ